MDRKLKMLLDSEGVRYERIPHAQTFTAMETAESAHVPGREMAKAVMLRVDGELTMAVVPATRQVDLDRLRGVAGARTVEMAREREFADLFPDCERGAMPPFGNLYGIRVFADDTLREDDQIAFNDGTHDEVTRMSCRDFERLVRPVVGPISEPWAADA